MYKCNDFYTLIIRATHKQRGKQMLLSTIKQLREDLYVFANDRDLFNHSSKHFDIADMCNELFDELAAVERSVRQADENAEGNAIDGAIIAAAEFRS